MAMVMVIAMLQPAHPFCLFYLADEKVDVVT